MRVKAAPRFERGASLAWALEGERGYREPASTGWRLATLARAPRRRPGLPLWLPGLLRAGPEVPRVRIAPAPGGGVRFEADFPFLVLRPGERAPRLEGPSVVVPRGAVLRAGPMLLAPLGAAQARALRSGALDLPRIAPETPPAAPRRARLTPDVGARAAARWAGDHAAVLIAAAAVLFVAAFVIYRMTAPVVSEARVLVSLQGMPPLGAGGGDETARRDVDVWMRSAGLEPVFLDAVAAPRRACRRAQRSGDDLLACAGTLGAHLVLDLRLDVPSGRVVGRVSRHGRRQPYPEHAVRVDPRPARGPAAVRAMWERGLAELGPQLLGELTDHGDGQRPSTPTASGLAF